MKLYQISIFNTCQIVVKNLVFLHNDSATFIDNNIMKSGFSTT